jgi:hypothetical protein
MVFKLSDAKEYGGFEDQGGLCRCDSPHENWVVDKICLIEVPMCAEMIGNAVKIGRHVAAIAGEISKFSQKLDILNSFLVHGAGNWFLIGTIIK